MNQLNVLLGICSQYIPNDTLSFKKDKVRIYFKLKAIVKLYA